MQVVIHTNPAIPSFNKRLRRSSERNTRPTRRGQDNGDEAEPNSVRKQVEKGVVDGHPNGNAKERGRPRKKDKTSLESEQGRSRPGGPLRIEAEPSRPAAVKQEPEENEEKKLRLGSEDRSDEEEDEEEEEEKVEIEDDEQYVYGDDNDDGNYNELENLDDDGYESPDAPAEVENFPLSKGRLAKSNIVYSNKDVLCVRIREKMVRLTRLTKTIRNANRLNADSNSTRPLRLVGKKRSHQSNGSKAVLFAATIPSICALDALAARDEVRFRHRWGCRAGDTVVPLVWNLPAAGSVASV